MALTTKTKAREKWLRIILLSTVPWLGLASFADAVRQERSQALSMQGEAQQSGKQTPDARPPYQIVSVAEEKQLMQHWEDPFQGRIFAEDGRFIVVRLQFASWVRGFDAFSDEFSLSSDRGEKFKAVGFGNEDGFHCICPRASSAGCFEGTDARLTQSDESFALSCVKGDRAADGQKSLSAEKPSVVFLVPSGVSLKALRLKYGDGITLLVAPGKSDKR